MAVHPCHPRPLRTVWTTDSEVSRGRALTQRCVPCEEQAKTKQTRPPVSATLKGGTRQSFPKESDKYFFPHLEMKGLPG